MCFYSDDSSFLGHIKYTNGLFLRLTGKAKGEFNLSEYVSTTTSQCRVGDLLMRIREVGKNPTDEFHEMHDAETHKYVISIVWISLQFNIFLGYVVYYTTIDSHYFHFTCIISFCAI